ncbi:hypothetical protein MGN01_03610 [Methylobacterium gnaphalii]|uniref:Uncharacterized protein n=1 Tax=Methylobacterium gnaphalii TaxID=1010610 RepID=A0A512JF04_9HYPH|nr:hypothetical protein MGN01_03610 [Methylobacterium gnaphalii]
MGGALLDDGGLQAELRGANGTDIAARAGADDDEIVAAAHDGRILGSVRRGAGLKAGICGGASKARRRGIGDGTVNALRPRR